MDQERLRNRSLGALWTYFSHEIKDDTSVVRILQVNMSKNYVQTKYFIFKHSDGCIWWHFLGYFIPIFWSFWMYNSTLLDILYSTNNINFSIKIYLRVFRFEIVFDRCEGISFDLLPLLWFQNLKMETCEMSWLNKRSHESHKTYVIYVLEIERMVHWIII